MRIILGMPNYECQGSPNSGGVRLAYMNTWHERLKLAKGQAGLRATDIAKAVGVSNATVSDWESGETKTIEGSNLLKVCTVLGVSPHWLIFGKGDMIEAPLTDDDRHAVKINRSLEVRERKAWYRAGDSLAEPDTDAEAEPPTKKSEKPPEKKGNHSQ